MESIISNTDVRIEIEDKKAQGEHGEYYSEPKFKPVGQPLEVGLIQFLLDNGEDINQAFINRNRFAPKATQLPFDQVLKRKVVIRPVQGDAELVRIYVKGAPEEVLGLCKTTLDATGNPTGFPTDYREKLLATEQDNSSANIHSMAAEGLKVLSFAFKEISQQDLNEITSRHPVESHGFRGEIESDLTYLCTFGMTDEVRGGIKRDVKRLQYGKDDDDIDIATHKPQVVVRILTGDHPETARQVAEDAGIVSET